MIDRRNRTRRILNAVAHRVLQAEGDVGATGLRTSDGRLVVVGSPEAPHHHGDRHPIQ